MLARAPTSPLQTVVAVEPSRVMINQWSPAAAPAVQAAAECLPIGTNAVDAAMAVLTEVVRRRVSPPAGERRYWPARGEDPRDRRPSRPHRADSSDESSRTYLHGERRPENRWDSTYHIDGRIIGTLLCHEIHCCTGQ